MERGISEVAGKLKEFVIMKKLLALVLVLGMASIGMASVAGAALQISVHTMPPGQETWDPMNPEESLIWVYPSDELILNVHAGADLSTDTYWVLYTKTALGTMTGGVAMDWGAEIDNAVFGDAGENYVPIMPDENGVCGGFGFWSTTIIPVDGIVADDILFHCEDEGDTTIILQEVTAYWELGEILDTVVIHQIPEPMTMALLGLGGLGLLRRRRA
jgi:PEP-CTERM motif-containing protein